MKKKRKIVVTGGTGRFGSVLKKTKFNYSLLFPRKNKLDITKFQSIKSYLSKTKPFCLIHLAGLSRPMKIHETSISKSIELNIIGTANIVRACKMLGIKLIYFSTSYVYPGTKGNYNERDALLPWNNYAWSKLGGECAVQMYKNSLIVRACVSEKPFLHKKAFNNVRASFLYHDQAAEIIFKLINKKGIINLGGRPQTIFRFAKKTNQKVKKINMTSGILPLDFTLNLNKLNKFK